MSRHVAVIGAGVVGAISAIEALKEGHRVTIIEPGDPGGEQAASYGNAGWLSSHSVIPPAEPGAWKKVPGFLLDPLGPLSIRWSHLPQAAPWLARYLASGWTAERVTVAARALRALLAGAPQLHAEYAQSAGAGHLIERRGVLHVYPSRAHFEADAAAWGIRRQMGVEWIELSAGELRQREPDLDSRYILGRYVEEAGSCRDPGAYVAALVTHACARGAQIVRDRATGFRIEAGSLKAVLAGANEIACDAAVIATGVSARPLAAAAGDRVPLAAERGYHAVIERPEAGPRTPMMAADCKAVASMTEKGLRIAGQVEIAAPDAAPNWRRAHILRDLLLRMFPGLPRPLPEDRIRYWLGCRPSMPDGLPCIGCASATRDIIYAFGHGHVGLVGSARTGRVVAQLLSGHKPEIPLGPYDPRRFA